MFSVCVYSAFVHLCCCPKANKVYIVTSDINIIYGDVAVESVPVSQGTAFCYSFSVDKKT